MHSPPPLRHPIFARHLPSAPLAIVLAAALALGACRGDPPPDDVPIQVDVSVAPTPPIVGPVRLVLTITDEAGDPVEDARVQVEGTMSHAGMTPVHDSASYQGQGRWVVPEFEFTMGGEWIMIIRVTLPDGREAVREREMDVVGGPPPQERSSDAVPDDEGTPEAPDR